MPDGNTLMPTEQILERYAVFVSKIDELSEKIIGRHQGRIVCRPGCDVCCQQFSVLPLEADQLARAAGKLKEKPDGKKDMCALLSKEGLCAAYESRPIICRTHGLPITSGELGGGVNCCPMNFRNFPLDTLEPTDIIDIDAINKTLIVLNALYLKALGRDPRSLERIGIACLVGSALSQRGEGWDC